MELKSKCEYQQLCFKLVCFCFKLSKQKKPNPKCSCIAVAVSLSIPLLVTESTGGALVTHHSLCFNDKSSLKALTTAAHLFSDLNGENCENEQYLTWVKHKASVVCHVIPQTMGYLAKMSGFISFSGPLVCTPVS